MSLEETFRASYAARSLPFVRAGLVLSIFLYLAFGALDMLMLPSAVREIWVIRVIVAIVLMLLLADSFSPSFLRTMQVRIALLPLLGGLGIILMIVVAREDPQSYHYYVGLLLALIYSYILTRLFFIPASLVGLVLLIVYTSVAVYLETPSHLLVNSLFFLVSFCFCGMVASYALEYYERRVFVQSRAISEQNEELTRALMDLRLLQARLVQQEKLASLGQLTSGIAHEILNPLNFINNFAILSEEIIVELRGKLEMKSDRPVKDVLNGIELFLSDLNVNIRKISEHGQRADNILKRMLEHSRGVTGERHVIDLNTLIEEYVSLACHGITERNVHVERDYDSLLVGVEVVPEEIGRVLLNLLSNAFYAAHEKRFSSDNTFTPTVHVSTRAVQGGIEIRVRDNGNGIPENVRQKIFQPFFTTKPSGKGTGLGLSISHDIIVQGYGGELTFHSEPGKGSVFVIFLPQRTQAVNPVMDTKQLVSQGKMVSKPLRSSGSIKSYGASQSRINGIGG